MVAYGTIFCGLVNRKVDFEELNGESLLLKVSV